MTTLKIFFTLPSGKEEIRRFTTHESNVFDAINAYLESTYVAKGFEPPLRFVIQYADEDGDAITVSSEQELQAGLQAHVSSAQGKQAWKLMCKFDDEMSPMPEMSQLSINSTPSTIPPSPSVKSVANESVGASSVPAAQVREESVQRPPTPSIVIEEPSSNTIEVQSPPASPSNVAPAAKDESSDDEYVRIDESGPEAVDPFEQHIEVKAADRWACKLCTKQFKARHFIVDHLNNRHSEIIKASTKVPEETAMPVETAAKVDEAPASVEQPQETVANATTVPVEVAPSTPTTEPESAKAPIVDEVSPKRSADVEIDDVTGHHEHVEPSPEPVASAPSAASSSKSPAVHTGVTCDGCSMSPIIGDRFHCTVCTMPGGFDLCSKCEALGNKHPSSHILLKMRVPAHVPVGAFLRGCRVVEVPKPRAQFISDISLADGVNVQPGEVLTKTWSIKNIGTAPWPAGTRLIFAGGDLAPESEGLLDRHGAIVPFAAAGETVHISIEIQVPPYAGRFRGTFRLETPERVRFGPRIWIDVTVPEEATSSAASSEPSAPVVEKKVEEAPKVAAPKVEEPKVEAPKVEEKKSDEPKVYPTLEEAPKASASSSSSAPVASAPLLQNNRQFVFSNELASLRSMGFTDIELCKYLLLNNQGDVQRVVSWLLNNTRS